MDGQKLPVDHTSSDVMSSADVAEPSSRRILVVTKTNFTRTIDGGTMRVSAIVNALRAAGFEVDWVAIRGNSSHSPKNLTTQWPLLSLIQVFLQTIRHASLSLLKWYSPSAVKKICDFRSRNTYVLSILEYSQLLPYSRLLPRPLMIDLHNIESELLANYAASATTSWKRALGTYESQRVKALESSIVAAADAVSVVSEHDKRRLLGETTDQDLEQRVVIAPNGVDGSAFEVQSGHQKTVVFVAHLGWQPNVDAAIWLVREVWPLVEQQITGYTLQLVGRDPAPEVYALASSTVEVHPNVPNALAYVAPARVATAPLLAAGGTRLKILEGLACGTPVAATSLGALGLERLISEGVLAIGDNPREFAMKVASLAEGVHDPARVRLSAEPYRWPKTLADFVARVNHLAGTHSERGTN
ncbi:UNVERIFIED_ORG: glycosyltransferase involved in cell wall biosynthesis [Arthrobacter sp. UYEF10]